VASIGRSSVAQTKAAALPQASKQSACLAVLERSEGATIRELQELTNWQEHSVRAFLAGTVKKGLGFDIGSAKEERGRVTASPLGSEADKCALIAQTPRRRGFRALAAAGAADRGQASGCWLSLE
jgi:Protein of unknown function (DUF3489)